MTGVIGDDYSTPPHNNGNTDQLLGSTVTISEKRPQAPSPDDSEWNLASQLRVGDILLLISTKSPPLTYGIRPIRSSSNRED